MDVFFAYLPFLHYYLFIEIFCIYSSVEGFGPTGEIYSFAISYLVSHILLVYISIHWKFSTYVY